MTTVPPESQPPPVVEVLSRRYAVLDTLATSPQQVRDLTDELEASRSTVSRALRDLEEADLVERTDDGYRANLVGQLALSLTREYYERIGDLSRLGVALEPLPPDAPLPPEAVVGGEAFLATSPDPYRPDEVVLEAFRSATRLRYVYRLLTDARLLRLSHEHLLEEDLTIEPITTPEMVAHLREEFPEKFAEALATGRYHLRVANDLPPFGLVLPECDGETTLLIGIGRPSGGVEALIRNDTPEAVAWGEAYYEEIRARSRPVEELVDDGSAEGSEDE